MGRSLNYTSLVGMIRNLWIGYVSTQYHVIYDNKFETVMGGFENNDAIIDYIWEILGEHDQALDQSIYPTTPHVLTLHQIWMPP